ncbi:hypothetical protein [Cognataquiflexum aquatile]|uniref:hypothetical protein n=1 Tax=Cognataquiflexum aquatile TaxID=2249427 RepID=UPI0018E54ED1|nr:hypothetical protein [Cognataquiflexum aquatile]
MKFRFLVCAALALFIWTNNEAQTVGNSEKETKNIIQVAAYDGIIVAGFVDGGGYTNFTGPNINMTRGDSRFILSALPSLRYKKDNSTPKNAFVTPTLGIGFTYSYKLFAVQVPLFYNSKTAVEDGRWHVGIGLGLRLNYLNRSKAKKQDMAIQIR